jgi:SAM-dependent methyltransferase
MASRPPFPPIELLCCPRCEGVLAEGEQLACTFCAVAYPGVGGLPWLFAEPDAVLGEWRARLHGYLAGLEAQATRYRAALGGDVTRASTRSRLKLLAAACSDHARRIRALMAPLGAGTGAAAPEMYSALGVTLPTGQGLASYYANLHRDWSWGEAENEAAYRLVDEALGGDPPGRTLLIGAGAGRLAFDLHRRRRPGVLVAADINPLFLLGARRLYDGEALELYEFPLAPRDVESHAILRRLQAPEAAAPGLHLVFADATRAPFASGAFDTVVTPWLIDVLDDDFSVFARRVNRWLKPGGRWVNSGSLSFGSDDPARRYALEEIREIVAESGFTPVEPREEAVPYLCSPASRHGRVETVVTFATSKRAAVATPGAARRVPPWLERTDLPVPLLPEFQGRQLELRVLAYVFSLVDGRRSVRDVAGVLVEQRLMAQAEAEPTVRAFLARLHGETRAGAATPFP